MSKNYAEDAIKTLDWKSHIRLRPGMYIGKLGDGKSYDDGIYVLLKEVMDNCIDEHTMGYGKKIEIAIDNQQRVVVRDYGRGIPLGKVVDAVSKINTSGKFDSSTFQKAVGLNGIGTKAVNALSAFFEVQSFREGQTKLAQFERGELQKESKILPSKEAEGTQITFTPDHTIFKNYHFQTEYIEQLINNYCYLNVGLKIVFNGNVYTSQKGLIDLLHHQVAEDELCYPIIQLKLQDIDICISHNNNYGELIFSFVNGQNTVQGGTHVQIFREFFVKVIRDYFKKSYDAADIRQGLVCAVAIRIQEPIFESQTKTKLGSQYTDPDGKQSLRSFIGEFLTKELDNFLHRNSVIADAIKKRIEKSENERKQLAGIKKLANERAKKANLHNKKLRDCRYHYNDKVSGKNKDEMLHKCNQSSIFITEGDSASGSITKARDPETQAVFSLRGKPLNSFGLTKKIVYENEEFNLLQHALNIEEGIEELRYKKVIIATDADVDGMHIRLLIITFFLQFFPDLVANRHVYILETPLYRLRNKEKTIYCYSDKEKEQTLSSMGTKCEITRFKGLGEISPDEFKHFIAEDMRIQLLEIPSDLHIQQMLTYYMGDNTQERQEFIIDNLYVEIDEVQEA